MGRGVLAQRDAYGGLYGLDEAANEVDPHWLARILENAAPKS